MLSFRFIPQEFLCAINIGIDKFVCHAMDLNFTAGRREVHDRVSSILINKVLNIEGKETAKTFYS